MQLITDHQISEAKTNRIKRRNRLDNSTVIAGNFILNTRMDNQTEDK